MTIPDENKIGENDALFLTDPNAFSETTTEMALEAANNPDDELLTAFLDGELSDEEKTRLEQRLESEPELTERYQKLNFAGRLVESLAPAPINDRLTASTMEMLSAVVQKEIAAAEKRRSRQTLLWLAIFFLAGLATFALGRWCVDRFLRPEPYPPLREPAAQEIPADGFPAPNGQPDRSGRGFPSDFRDRSGGAHMNERRPRDIKQALPEELRGEDLGPVHQELFAFVKEKYGDKFSKIPKEEILYRFISERSVASFVERLSDKGKKYMEPLDDEQKIRLVGLLILTELHELRKERFNDAERRMSQNREKNRTRRQPAAEPPLTPNKLPTNDTAKNAPGDVPKETAGFYWKNESTGELAETLQKLSPEQRDGLLNLPDEEMYAQLLILHWGFDPKQVNPAGSFHPPGGRGFPDRDFSPDPKHRLNDRDENRSDTKRPDTNHSDTNRQDRPEPIESWNRFLDNPRTDETW